jgi:malate dehydrogenase (oxaloacetate-decarboxylating)(NADP+)
MRKRKRLDALNYHAQGRPGKVEVVPTKPYSSQLDLSLAYSPGVADPCLEIAAKPEDAYKYTAKGNLVAVISNGSAVLGLGDIGPLAAKPVMEGKALLFKIFADIDVFDIELDANNVDDFVRTVKAISPTFGGINLEDIKAPESFEIESRLKKELAIPVMHDDQHGTAIISSAALLNAIELTGKKLETIQVVVNGAGAAAMACAKLYVALGVRKENMVMLDSKGVINNDRKELSAYKRFFATNRKLKTLQDAMMGADVFLGLSKGGVLNKSMIQSMAKDPIVFALANPDPEIPYEDAIASRPDVIVATGRSDYPNQVNNVLGFPYIFRGALDVRATGINDEMKLAAVHAIAQLTKETVPEEVNMAYGIGNLTFGRDFIIPKPMDHRLLTVVAPAVAKAAMDSGIALAPIVDWEAYEQQLIARMGRNNKLIRNITDNAKAEPKRVVFAEADNYKVLKAAQIVKDEGIAIPILLGNHLKISQLISDNNLDLDEIEVIDPKEDRQEANRKKYGKILFERRQRKGYTFYEACQKMRERSYYGAMMVEEGVADAFVSGITRNYPDAIKPALQIIGKEEGVNKIAGMYMMITKRGGVYFFADTTININPTAQDLIDITLLTAKAVRNFHIEPQIALLSFSNFGSSKSEETTKVAEAVTYLHKHHSDLVVDGEMQANFALNETLLKEKFSFSTLADKKVNTLIFPNLTAGNIAYKLVSEMAEVEAIGPILLGIKKPVHILQLGSSVREIVSMVTIAASDAQKKQKRT